MSEQRHPATEKAWEWLEHGEGSERDEVSKARIRIRLVELDELLHALDEEQNTDSEQEGE